jgi:hypothetical protein
VKEPTKTVKPRPDRRKSVPGRDRWFPEHVEEKPPTSFLAARHRTLLWRL